MRRALRKRRVFDFVPSYLKHSALMQAIMITKTDCFALCSVIDGYDTASYCRRSLEASTHGRRWPVTRESCVSRGRTFHDTTFLDTAFHDRAFQDKTFEFDYRYCYTLPILSWASLACAIKAALHSSHGELKAATIGSLLRIVCDFKLSGRHYITRGHAAAIFPSGECGPLTFD